MVHRRGFIEEGFLERGSWRGAPGEGSPGGGLPLGGERGRKGGTLLPWAKEGSRTSGVEVGGKKCWAHRCGRKGRRRPHRCAQHLLPPTSTPEGRARHFPQKIAHFPDNHQLGGTTDPKTPIRAPMGTFPRCPLRNLCRKHQFGPPWALFHGAAKMAPLPQPGAHGW